MILKKIETKRLAFTLEWRESNMFFGRFGGGWDWKLGIQIGGHTVIINLLVCSLRLDIKEDL